MKFYLSAILALMAILMSGIAQSATLTVGEANGNYATIQDAVYDAAPGDVIEVYPGIYFENVYVDKSITLRGAGAGGSLPVIDAGGSGAAITLLADGATLERFHVVNSSGGGIEVYSNNNVITANFANKNQYGIYLINASNNNVSENIASDNARVGIEVYNSSGNIIRNNVADNNSAASYNRTQPSGYGIYLSGSGYNTVIGNTANGNQLDALTLFDSWNNTLINNSASGNKEGIYLYRSNGSTIINNRMIGNSATGMFVESSFYCAITNNDFEDNGITGLNLWKSWHNILRNNHMTNNKYNFDADGPNDIDTSNLIDGKKIYYLVSKSDLVIDDSSMAGTVYCTDCNNITVKFLDLGANDMGISLRNTDNSLVCSNQITDIEGGIYLENSKHNIIIGNIIKNSKNNGIFVGDNSDGNVIRCNDINNSLESGIGVQDSWINIIKGNTVANNALYGIYFYSSSENTATGNVVKDNLVPGIFINGTSKGNYICQNKIISSSGIAVYDEFISSLNYTTPGNIYAGNDYTDLDLGCEATDPCCGAENICSSGPGSSGKCGSNECCPDIDCACAGVTQEIYVQEKQ